MQGRLHLSACPQPWALLGPWPLERPLAMRPHPSCTSCQPTSSPTHSCCTITFRRMPRAAQVPEASLAPCSPNLKLPNLPTATLHTGQTKPRREWGRAYPWQERTPRSTFLRAHCPGDMYHSSAKPLWGACLPEWLLYVMYLCMYL